MFFWIELLDLRRLRANLLICHKILPNFVDIHHEDFFTLNTVIKTRGNSLKLLMPYFRVDARADFFLVRMIMVWA